MGLRCILEYPLVPVPVVSTHPLLWHHNKRAAANHFAAAIWGHAWRGKLILCHCDNEAVVTIINSGTSKEPEAMALLRCLFFIAARNNLLITAAHLPGSLNQVADALSRNNLPLFFTIYPQADPHPSVIPPALIDLLVLSKPDWTSQSWNKMLNTIFNQPCQKTP